jgi:hypothetical protein
VFLIKILIHRKIIESNTTKYRIKITVAVIANNTTLDFLINIKILYSIINRVNSLRCQVANFLTHNRINTAFMATPKINNYLGGLNFSEYFDLSNSPINIQKGLNSFSHHVSIDYKNERYSWPAINPQMQIINSCGNHYNIPTLSTSPFFNCSCNNVSGSPHEILIKNALNL